MQKIKLGEVLDVKRGPSLSSKYFSKIGDKIRLTLGNFNYPNGGFKRNVSKEDIYYVGSVNPRYILRKGDIITPLTEQVRGLLGSTATIPESNKYIQNGDVALVIPNENLINKRFSYYLISSAIVKSQLDAGSQQTKIRHTSPDNIKNCIAYIPSEIKIQEKIANLLDMINLKISHNTEINTQLEELAKTIYDYWFLQFEFPNEEGKPYKSSGGKMVYNEQLKREIPEGWEVLKVKDLLNVITGKEDANFACNNGKYRFFTCSQEILKCNRYAFNGKSILLAGNGDFNVKHFNGKFNAYQRTYVLIPNNEIYYGVLYMATTKLVVKLKAGSNGSIIKFITKGDVENIEILKPLDTKIYHIFNKILNFIEMNEEENQELSSLRDFLLPLLMNGQVTFKDENEEVKNKVEKFISPKNLERYNQWKQTIGYAARGEADDEILKKIYDVIDDDDKK